jgi:uronate dehydrogenase
MSSFEGDAVPSDETVLITGADGVIGTRLRGSLRRPGRHLRLLDLMTQAPLADDEDAHLIVGSFMDPDLMDAACAGVDSIIHLGGLARDGYTWDEYLDVNIDGTHVVLEAARRSGVSRVIYASSNHAVGFQPCDTDAPAPDYLFPRPDSFYGVSKVASESLCSLYHDRYGLDAVCLRIGSYRERPDTRRALWSWLSPDDCTRLFEAALTAPSPGYRVVWGVSANTRAVVSLDEAKAIGYQPLDDAEAFLEEVTANDDLNPATLKFIGGRYATAGFEETS